MVLALRPREFPGGALLFLTVRLGVSVPPVSILVGLTTTLHGALVPVVSSSGVDTVLSLDP